MMDTSLSLNEYDDGDSSAMTLVKSINISYQHSLPDPNPHPALTSASGSKATAKALRAQKNLGPVTDNHQRHPPRHSQHPPHSRSSQRHPPPHSPPRPPHSRPHSHPHPHCPTPHFTTSEEETEEGSSIQKDSGDKDVSKKSSGPSDAGILSLSKRPRSSSPISPTHPGSKENPIDVDGSASLLEPTVTREYVRTLFFNSLLVLIRVTDKEGAHISIH